jgi:hypothetical protein
LGADAIPKSRLGGTVGADGLPKMLAVVLAILSAGLIVQTLLTARVAGPAAASAGEGRGHRSVHLRALGMVAIGAVYIAMVPYLGYFVSVALLLLGVALYNGKRPSRGLVLFGILGAAFFYVLFVQVLDVPLPPGIWPKLIG